MTQQKAFQYPTASTPTPTDVESYEFPPNPIRGYPELHWQGKRPFTSTNYYPAQRKEIHGPAVDGWRNKLYWGDNLQVMSHLLKEYRGQVQLVYIDPPFDSKAEYKKRIKLRGGEAFSDHSAFEEKQYSDIWTNDEYLHCDPTKGHYLKIILDEVFGQEGFQAEISWKKTTKTTSFTNYGSEHDLIYFYAKTPGGYIFNQVFKPP